jgi:PLD-like domain
LSGATDAASLLSLTEALPLTTIRFLPSLHAKVYVTDERFAVVTSSNFTDSGMLRNLEYGVSFDEPKTVAAIRADVLQYSQLGSAIDQAQLRTLVHITEDLRDLSRRAERSINKRLRQEFSRRLAAADAEILRTRAAGRTAHAIFADTILHLLSGGPLRTADLHQSIQRIHPDLCDDSVDRVIAGQHFGKKWKHGVRTAQVFLRRAGQIERVGERWRLAT